MSFSESIAAIAEEVGNYKHAVVKSRNRHREVTSKLTSISQRLKDISKGVADLQKIGETNATMLDEIEELFRKGHLVFPQNIDKPHKSYLLGIFRSIPQSVRAFESCSSGILTETFSEESSCD